MVTHLDLDAPAPYVEAVESLLARYEGFVTEADLTSAIRDFFVVTGLATPDEIREEHPPGVGSIRRVDLAVPDRAIFVEVKQRVGTHVDSSVPDPDNVDQIDGYVSESGSLSAVGVLTDGKHWFLRTVADIGEGVRDEPYRFTLETVADWYGLFDWLQGYVFLKPSIRPCTEESLRREFGPGSPSRDRHVAAIRALYEAAHDCPSVRVKRELWEMLLGVALGEVAGVDLDDLFVRHTYLVSVVGMITQAVFGLDIGERAHHDPFDLVLGTTFRYRTGLANVVESDFFSWIVEYENAEDTLRSIAEHVDSFAWNTAPEGEGPGSPGSLVSVLYQTVIPAEERKKLGEYYTPDWLAAEIVRTAVTDPLNDRMLDPACGSGAFLVEGIRHLMASAAGCDPSWTLTKLQRQVTGIDVHPVAVHLARASWVIAAREVIMEAQASDTQSLDISIPVYLGDSLQLLYDRDSILDQTEITVPVTGDPRNRELRFPRSLVAQPEKFDPLMTKLAEAIHADDNPLLVLGDHELSDGEQEVMADTVEVLLALHGEGRNHVWAYYTRNLLRPIAISETKVDVIVGNPPWLTYNKTVRILRQKLRSLSKAHRIWIGGNQASNQDIAGLFFLRSMDLYLPEGGACSMVMPHSALNQGQYEKWRTGSWGATTVALTADLSWHIPWDLEPLRPNDFFPVPACVVHAQRTPTISTGLPDQVERWTGGTLEMNPRRLATRSISLRPSSSTISPYGPRAHKGADIYPRCLFFVEETIANTTFTAAGTKLFSPRRGPQDKKPWKELSLVELTNSTVETAHVFQVYLGETVAPYVTLPPLRAVLPISTETKIERDAAGGVYPESLTQRARARWLDMNNLWNEHKRERETKTLLQQLDHLNKLSAQLDWQHDNEERPFRVVYTSSGRPTAAIVECSKAVIDHTLYWISCDTRAEAHYLLAVINSNVLRDKVKPFMPKGQFGARHLHKHLWKLPIPKYDPNNPTHTAVSEAGKKATRAAKTNCLDQSKHFRTIRNHLRSWLQESLQGTNVEQTVSDLIK